MNDNSLDQVAVVTGAARGIGRGIALVLGRLGMTVYVTDIESRNERHSPLTGTVEDTADAVSAEGGRGIAVHLDHADHAAVADFFQRVRREQDGIDLLVLNAFNGNKLPFAGKPFWELDPAHWENMFESGVRGHIVAASQAAPQVIARKGLVVLTGLDGDAGNVLGKHLYYDLAMRSVSRLAFSMNADLTLHGATAVAVAPGFTRTEAIVAALGNRADAADPVDWPGRLIAALYRDERRQDLAGSTASVSDLGRRYGMDPRDEET